MKFFSFRGELIKYW